jgi:hypothetical protein
MVSKRWEVLFYLFSGVLINYCLRVNLSIAASEIVDDLGWSDYQKGYLLSSFFWGYSVGQIPSTLIAQRYGHKYTFGGAVLFSSLVTFFFPSACQFSFPLALFTRALTGLMSSALFPSSYHFFPRWIPLNEKTLMISLFGSGMYMGEIIGFSLSGYLVSSSSSIELSSIQIGGWPSAFYFFSVVGLLWTPFYFYNVYGSPEDHPSITFEERQLIRKGLLEDEQQQQKHEIVIHSQQRDEETEDGKGDQDRLLGHTSRTPSHSSAQPELRKRISSIGGAIASESLYVPPNLDPHPSGGSVGYSSLPLDHLSTSSSPGGATSSFPSHQQQSPLLSHDQLHPLVPSTSSRRAMNDLTFSDIPWLAFATRPEALVLFLCHWCYAFVGFILLTEIPAFLTEELGYEIESAGLLSIAPYAANFISTILFAMYFDRVEVSRAETETERE